MLRNVGTFGLPGDTVGTNNLEIRILNGLSIRAEGRGGYNVPSLYGLALGAPYFHHGQAKTLNNLGRIHLYRGYHRDALDALQRALDIFLETSGAQHQAIETVILQRARPQTIEGFGKVERIVGTEASHFYKKIFGRTGIIYIQDYWKRHGETTATGDHIDVWNGYRSSTKWLMEWFSWLGYYSNYVQAKEIWFWDVK